MDFSCNYLLWRAGEVHSTAYCHFSIFLGGRGVGGVFFANSWAFLVNNYEVPIEFYILMNTSLLLISESGMLFTENRLKGTLILWNILLINVEYSFIPWVSH